MRETRNETGTGRWDDLPVVDPKTFPVERMSGLGTPPETAHVTVDVVGQMGAMLQLVGPGVGRRGAVGRMEVLFDGNGNLHLDTVQVQEGHQGEGVATALAVAAHSQFPGAMLVHSSFVSDAGWGFAQKMVRDFPAWNVVSFRDETDVRPVPEEMAGAVVPFVSPTHEVSCA